MIRKLLPFGLAGVVIIGGIVIATRTPTGAQSSNEPITTTETTDAPDRLTISVRVLDPEDLKVVAGDVVKVGDIIADRQRERTRLNSQRRQLQLSLTKLKGTTISPPVAPQTIPAVLDLPAENYAEYDAAVVRAQAIVDQREQAIALKQEEIAYLSGLENLDPIVLEHEQVKLTQLQQVHTEAVRDYQLAVARLNSAQDDRKYQEYEASLSAARRVEEQNQAQLAYQRQYADYEQRLREKEFQSAQLQVRLGEVDNAIASLATLKAKYSGTVRRIKWLAQNPDSSLTAELTFIVDSGEDTPERSVTVPE